jgi:hypothetical protein
MLGHIPDLLAIVGTVLVSVGVALALGVGWGLVAGGVLVLGGAAVTAKALG